MEVEADSETTNTNINVSITNTSILRKIEEKSQSQSPNSSQNNNNNTNNNTQPNMSPKPKPNKSEPENNTNNNQNNDNNNNTETESQTNSISTINSKSSKSKNKKLKRPKCYKRVQKELRDILLSDLNCVSAAPKNNNNLLEWMATIIGPSDTPYSNGKFYLDIKFPKDYPFSPPLVICKTRIYHCNFSKNGNICLDILKDQWSPALDTTKILLSIIALLESPNPDDPLDPDIAQHYIKNKDGHDQTAKEWTQRYAKSQ